MENMEEYWMWLCSVPGLYRKQILGLTDYFGSPRAVYEAPEAELAGWQSRGRNQGTVQGAGEETVEHLGEMPGGTYARGLDQAASKKADQAASKKADRAASKEADRTASWETDRMIARETAWARRVLEYRKKQSPEEVSHRLREQGINFISHQSRDFPERLKHIPDCPAGLFFRGRLPQDERPCVAIVGARQCSNYGRTLARELGGALAQAGVQIVSGLALGIDGTAQRAVWELGRDTYGVLGCGVDICYPRENFDLYCGIPRSGGVLSELPPGTQPLKIHFPMRNRLISGLADAVVVVEARERSGSLITADLALEQGREVYAVPGRVNDRLSAGCNRLIQQGAGLVPGISGLLEELGVKNAGDGKMRKEKLSLAPEEELVYSNLDLLPKGLEELAALTALPVGRLAGILVRLQIAGLAAEISKNQYVKL